MDKRVLVKTENIQKFFSERRGLSAIITLAKANFVRAVDSINLEILKGETLGICGESGCGKTTFGLLLALLIKPTGGRILFDGIDISSLTGIELKLFRKRVQMIFQDSYSTLDPRYTIYSSVSEPLHAHNIETNINEEVTKMLERVGLIPAEDFESRYPHEFSGGQRQRAAIARALIIKPDFVIADEPVSMVDTSIKISILNLMLKLKEEMGTTYILITHDMSIARYMCDRIAIMYLGKIVELGSKEEVIFDPLHPYSKALISAVRVPDPTYKSHPIQLTGEVPDPINLPRGCRFHPRCQLARAECIDKEPQLEKINGRFVACHKISLLG